MPDNATSADPAVQAQLDRLTMLSPGRDVLGLGRITALLDRLGSPHHALPPVFHVAGTNGKGSTCAFLRAMLEAAGHRVHVYTSPHLCRFNERIRLAGQLIDDAVLAPLLAEVLDCSEDIRPSFFEATTAAAFLAFARTPGDACVIEVGLGGRLDATNVIERPLVCGIAQIGIDHEAFLLDPSNGPDWPPLERIAWEKAGIAKPGVPLVTMGGWYSDGVKRVIEATAQHKGAPYFDQWSAEGEGADGHLVYGEGRAFNFRGPAPAMAGCHQLRNAGLAISMLRRQSVLAVSEDDLRAGVAAARWPGRLQKLAPGPLNGDGEVWIDGAHNAAAARLLAHELTERPMHLIVGILASKDADGIVSALEPHALSLTFVEVPGHASHDPEALVARFGGKTADSVPDALRGLAASCEPILIAGSLYLAGEVLRLNDQLPD